MIHSARRRHLATMVVGPPLLMGVLLAAYLVRPGDTVTDFPASLADESDNAPAWFESTSLFSDLSLRVSISETGQLELESDHLLGPSVLVYFRQESTDEEGVAGALLLGSLATGVVRRYRLPDGWHGGGQLLLYSLGHMEVVAVSSPLPTPQLRDGDRP